MKYTISDCDNTTKVDSNDNKNDNHNEEKSDIVYKTFSSPNTDFTFEYPDTWVYEEMENNDTKVWRFYSESDNDHNSKRYLEVHYPIEDPGAIDFLLYRPRIKNKLKTGNFYTLFLFTK